MKINGDAGRLRRCMERAAAGEELTLGFLGGSITQGSLASSVEKSYSFGVMNWWKSRFPQAVFHCVNAGIGGTSSHFAAARVWEDLLMYRPDVVVVDFSVNDQANAFFQETFEGVIRRIFYSDTRPAVIVLNNVFYDTGENAQELHNAVAEHYGIPQVSIRDTLYQEIKAGKYAREDITPDGLHPNDFGHALVAGELARFLEEVKEEARRPLEMAAFAMDLGRKEIGEQILRRLEERREKDARESIPADLGVSAKEERKPAPLTANAYEYAIRHTLVNSRPMLMGFRADPEEKKGHLDFFKNGWVAVKEGDAIVFELECSCLAVQYRRTIKRPAPRAEVILDGCAEKSWILDGNFDEEWGDCLAMEAVLHHGKREKHRVEIRIIQADPHLRTPFYLLALITA